MRFTKFLSCLAAIMLCVAGLQAQELTRILFVLDASNSMNGQWQSQDKMDAARKLLDRSLNELKGTPDLELALRAYGHGSSIALAEQNCDDTELLVPFGSYRYAQISEALATITPQGTTPIARSLEKAADDFPDADGKNIIILITDGIEACDEDPCAVSLALQRKGVILKPFVIGIGMEDVDPSAFECIGRYYDASSEATFETVLNGILSQALNNTSAQINLLDSQLKPTETNVPLSLRNNDNGQVLYQFVHTMNEAGLPDTLTLDPAYAYDITAHTIPPVTLEGALLRPGAHTTLKLETPQGTLDLRIQGRNAYKDLKCLVRAKGSETLINVQDFNSTTRYLTGSYDLEILTLPRTYISDVTIKNAETIPVAIPSPGVLNLILPTSGHGCIQQLKGQEHIFVCNLDSRDAQQQFVLQPGTYKVVYRSRNARQSIYTLEQEFEIRSETRAEVRL